MKIVFKNNTPVIVSHFLASLLSFIFIFRCRAVAIFPFIIVRDEKTLKSPDIINHESIHIRQYIETLFFGILIIGLFEYLYAVIFLKKNRLQAYYFMSHEQEAHQNDQNLSYLKTRPIFSYFKYMKLKNKKNFTLLNGKRVVQP